VEQSAEEVAPPDVRRGEGRRGPRVGSAATIRRSQVECSVWTLLVERSAWAFAFGARIGVRTISRPSLPKEASYLSELHGLASAAVRGNGQ
jgi:hypothetical protein